MHTTWAVVKNYSLKKIQACMGFEHCTGIAEAMRSNPVGALKIFRAKICNCLNCAYNCYDQILISPNSVANWVWTLNEKFIGCLKVSFPSCTLESLPSNELVAKMWYLVRRRVTFSACFVFDVVMISIENDAFGQRQVIAYLNFRSHLLVNSCQKAVDSVQWKSKWWIVCFSVLHNVQVSLQ